MLWLKFGYYGNEGVYVVSFVMLFGWCGFINFVECFIICCIYLFYNSSWDLFGGYLILFRSLFVFVWKLWKLGFYVVEYEVLLVLFFCFEIWCLICCIGLIYNSRYIGVIWVFIIMEGLKWWVSNYDGCRRGGL